MNLIVFGANDIARCLLRWAPDLGYTTVLVESRHDKITDELRALAGAVAPSFADVAAGDSFDAAHVDHDAPGMAEEVAAVLKAGARTVSLLASRRHAPEFLEAIRASGAGDDDVARVNTPAGLDLGGRSAPEIALSVLAGLVAARYGRDGGWLGPH
jgi:xanthine dehydrogenase accessory factor